MRPRNSDANSANNYRHSVQGINQGFKQNNERERRRIRRLKGRRTMESTRRREECPDKEGKVKIYGP